MRYRGFELDAFQEQAIRHLVEGRSVLVSAPTGNGKTIIADWIVDEAIRLGRKVVYTAPIKALSNQKYRDYSRLHGPERIGLVTGDLVINPDAPCRVMTTEILRNMLLAGQPLDDLLAVVIDEIHFLDDPERGTVWEEVLIYLPPEVQIVGLSATIANLDEFAEWLSFVRGRRVQTVRAFERVVPLRFHFASRLTGLCTPREYHLRAKKLRDRAEPALDRRSRQRGRRFHRDHGFRHRRPVRLTRDTDLFRMLADRDMLPYLYFVFSRRDTEVFARGLADLVQESLLDPEEQPRLDAALLQAAPLVGSALDPELRAMYAKGIAFHHAGLHVQLKALVESLYEQKLIKVLYCTSTFALGINMPARTVVFDGAMKFDGQRIAPLTTRQFMQKAGRAGRRGMDEEGHVVVRVDPEEYETLAPVLERLGAGEYEPVRSSFDLSWNSVVNLLHRLDEARIRELLDKSYMSWSLSRNAERAMERASHLEDLACTDGRKSGRQRKEARRLRQRADRAESRCWAEFQQKVLYLQQIGYLDANRGFNAGARVLMHLQIAEILVTELVLSGLLDELDPDDLFGVLCGLTGDLGRNVVRNFVLGKRDRALARAVAEIRNGPVVAGAEELGGGEVLWTPELLVVGRAWAQGQPLSEILLLVPSETDISGDLITDFRRAKDLAGQLREVHAEVPDRAEMLAELIRKVGRDEVEVID